MYKNIQWHNPTENAQKQQTNKIDNKQMCSTFGKLCLILYICYGLFYCSYFSDAEDCIILAGFTVQGKTRKCTNMWTRPERLSNVH